MTRTIVFCIQRGLNDDISDQDVSDGRNAAPYAENHAI